ncbi:hypothetical protein M2140_002049 [Clostridiales Family XIII bacterium PM5-7]
MKKGTFLIIILVIILSLYGCNPTSTPSTEGEKKAEASYEEVTVDLGLQESESATCCYCTDSKMVFSVGKRNDAKTGPLVNTEYLMLYDYMDNGKTEKYSMKTEAYIYNAIPYKEGILYATYDGAYTDKTPWSVNYIDKNGIKELDSGTARNYENIPHFAMIEDVPVYVFEDFDKNSYRAGTKKVLDMKVESIFENADDEQLCTSGVLPSNGKQYMIMVGSEEDEYATAVIGDENGIVKTHTLKEKLISYGINKDYAVCSTALNDNTFSMVAIDLADGTTSYTDAGRALYRITGGEGDSMVSVDYTFDMFSINTGEKSTKNKLNFPDGITKEEATIIYYPTSASSYIVSMDNNKYYKMTIIQK